MNTPGAAFSTLFIVIMLMVTYKLHQMRMTGSSYKLYKPEEIAGTFDDIIGQDEIKRELKILIDTIQNGSHYSQYGVNQPSNILFSGPPGTGKTKIAGYFAKELGFPLIYMSAASLETGLVGGGARTIGNIAQKAKSLKKVVIFLDEAQTLLMKRGEDPLNRHIDNTINALLTALDGVSTNKSHKIIWILASNFDDSNLKLDSAIMRRFQKQINFGFPGKEERIALFKHFVHQANSDKIGDIDYDDLAAISHHLSPATIANIVKEAASSAAAGRSKIDTSTLIDAFERGVIGLTRKRETSVKNRDDLYIATHELGHFFAHYHSALKEVLHEQKLRLSDFTELPKEQQKRLRLLARERCDIIKISIQGAQKSEGGSLGYALFKPDEEEVLTLAEFTNKIVDLYGGLAAEQVIFGESAISMGAIDDLERIKKLSKKLYNSGFKEIGLLQKSRKRFLKDRYHESMAAVSFHKEELLQSRQKLITRGKLTIDEIIPVNALKDLIEEEAAQKNQSSSLKTECV